MTAGNAVVVLAAGSGSRVGAAVNKVLLPLDGVATLAWSVTSALRAAEVRRVVLVVRDGEEAEVRDALAAAGVADPRVRVVTGGADRHASETRALQSLRGEVDRGDVDVVAIHDAARPWAGSGLFDAVIGAARDHGGALPVLDVDCVVARDGRPLPDRLVAVQTPQAFRAAPLLEAYAEAEREGFSGTDTAACLERFRPDVAIAAVAGDPANRKITYPDDLPEPRPPTSGSQVAG